MSRKGDSESVAHGHGEDVAGVRVVEGKVDSPVTDFILAVWGEHADGVLQVRVSRRKGGLEETSKGDEVELDVAGRDEGDVALGLGEHRERDEDVPAQGGDPQDAGEPTARSGQDYTRVNGPGVRLDVAPLDRGALEEDIAGLGGDAERVQVQVRSRDLSRGGSSGKGGALEEGKGGRALV